MSNASGSEPRQVPVDLILDLRHRVLRPGLPFESARFDGDLETNTAHFACLDPTGRVIGCATVIERSWEGASWQLRGMAVDANMRKSGVGRLLVVRIEDHIRQLAGPKAILWCNARLPASPFYEKCGWVVRSDVFDIPSAGPHVKMTRHLD
jgi:N-acetylglutamate synthase-like GNAT family acetyltransferase